MIKRIFCALLFVVGIAMSANAQAAESVDWEKEATRSCRSLVKNFWGASFPGNASQKYFNDYGGQASLRNEWWWQAHAMDVVIDEYNRTKDDRWLQMFEPWYEGIQGANYEDFDDDPLHNNSIDDMEWLCITMIRMYEACGDRRYFNHARRLYDRYIITTWGPEDEAPWHGGISWSTKADITKTKNACSNGPGGIIAYMLARNLHGAERKKYFDDLKRIYAWEREVLFDKETGAVNDHIGYNGVWDGIFAYNTGTFIAMAHQMFVVTRDTQYIDDAKKAADFTMRHFAYGKLGLMSLTSDQEWGGDHGLFHGIFFRYLTELLQAIAVLDQPTQQRYTDYLRACGTLAVQNLVEGVDIFSRDWENIRITDPKQAPLTPHVTGATLMEMLAML